MIAHNNTSSENLQYKDKVFQAQFERVYQAFLKSPMTMKEADVQTGIMRENICRYVRALRLNNRIAKIKRRRCKVTKSMAWELTTNPELFPINGQLTLF